MSEDIRNEGQIEEENQDSLTAQDVAHMIEELDVSQDEKDTLSNTLNDDGVEAVMAAMPKPSSDFTDRMPLRNELVSKGFTKEDATEVRKTNQLTEEEVASGEWIKVSELDKICRQNSIPISRMVRAMGGDRAMLEPLDERFAVKWQGGKRYVSKEAASPEALQFLVDLAPARREKKAKSEDEDNAMDETPDTTEQAEDQPTEDKPKPKTRRRKSKSASEEEETSL